MGNQSKDILIVIPAYNEEKTIGSVIEDLRAHGYNHILVIDDGSIDKTFEIAASLNVYVVKHIINIGAGGASTTGIEIAKIIDPKIIVTFDADGQHKADEIIKLVTPIQNDEVDVVIGSRFLEKSVVPPKRFIYNKIANLVTFILYGFSLSDTQSGLKAFNRKAYNAINIDTLRMEFCSEIIYRIKQEKLRIKEVNVKPVYSAYSLSKGQNFFIGITTFSRLVSSRIFGRR